jgi:hypothetical protein
MHIKSSTMIPVGTKITKCPPSNGMKAKSVFSMERAHERKLEQAEELKVQAQKFAAALKAGFTAAEALKHVKSGK